MPGRLEDDAVAVSLNDTLTLTRPSDPLFSPSPPSTFFLVLRSRSLPLPASVSHPPKRPNVNLHRPPHLLPQNSPPPPPRRRRRLLFHPISATHRREIEIEIDMVRNPQGVYSPKPKKVVILWDLDNKPPRGPPYEAAMSLKQLGRHLGHLVDISAYANRHAFVHLPEWVLQERRERRRLDSLERSSPPPDPYVCSVCGRKCRTHGDLKKHFKQLHERERQKKLDRMRQLKGKKRQRYKERFVTGNVKYEEAARELIRPKTGYGLAGELRRAGVFVKMVEDKPQAADWAVKRQMQHSMSRGIDWVVLVSDDKDFSEMVRRAREACLRTLVVGDSDGGWGGMLTCGCLGSMWRMGRLGRRICFRGGELRRKSEMSAPLNLIGPPFFNNAYDHRESHDCHPKIKRSKVLGPKSGNRKVEELLESD
ncbi:hypothetical protein Syun_004776 [Stephania yunnanensis]|uniref:C2H2-type domain-containing protein n=1 Tax=Stephania yunnanensis TaxID=152371 RepID=A0AAP0L7T4_9MAGN